MASRSTRRNQKNLEIPKMDKCQKEEESPEKKEADLGRRRSLRHSPGSSISPPRKTRKTKADNSPSSIENKAPKSTSNSDKSPESDEDNDTNNKSENTLPITPNKRNTRLSKVTAPSPRSTRNTVLVNSTSNKSLVNNIDTAATTSRRSTRNRINNAVLESVTEFENDEPKVELPITPKGRKNRTLNAATDNHSQSPSTSQNNPNSSRKRVLSTSPDLSNDQTNGTAKTESKRLCKSPISKETTNGKVAEEDSENIKVDHSINCNELSKLKISSEDIKSNNKNESLKNGQSSLSETIFSNKRRLSNSPEPVVITDKIPKKLKLFEEKSVLEKLSDISISKSADKSEITQDEEMEISCNAKVLLKEFGLTAVQCTEILQIIPELLRDATNVDILEFLVKQLLTESTSLSSMSSPRFNKLLRQLLMKYCTSDTSIEKKHNLCESALEWSKERKSMNLRHELELALMTLYYDTKCYRKAEEIATALYKETKKLQDKEKTVKACLCLSKAYHAMGNISKARANITTAKTEALKIYTPPDLQGDLDLQSGIMQVSEEKDMETAFSYFKEAATGFIDKPNRSRSLKYMLLTKLLVNRPEEGEKAVRSAAHVEDIDTGVEAMLSITKAAIASSLADFKKARDEYTAELQDDLVVRGVLDQLYCKMLEKNLLTIIAPYERIQISVVADRIGLERVEVERRLSQMILDKEINAQLDHRDDCLYVYKPEKVDKVFKSSIDSVSQLDKTLSLLNKRVKQLL